MSGAPWWQPVPLRRLYFDVMARPKVNDAKPKGCVWNRWRGKRG